MELPLEVEVRAKPRKERRKVSPNVADLRQEACSPGACHRGGGQLDIFVSHLSRSVWTFGPQLIYMSRSTRGERRSWLTSLSAWSQPRRSGYRAAEWPMDPRPRVPATPSSCTAWV